MSMTPYEEAAAAEAAETAEVAETKGEEEEDEGPSLVRCQTDSQTVSQKATEAERFHGSFVDGNTSRQPGKEHQSLTPAKCSFCIYKTSYRQSVSQSASQAVRRLDLSTCIFYLTFIERCHLSPLSLHCTGTDGRTDGEYSRSDRVVVLYKQERIFARRKLLHLSYVS